MAADGPTARRRDRAETCFAEWLMRVEAGDAESIDDLAREHPELVEDLCRLHGEWLRYAPMLRRLVPGSISLGAPLPDVADDEGRGEDSEPGVGTPRLDVPHEERYRFRGVLGRGGGGAVLRVWDCQLNRPLAMKVVLGVDEDAPTSDAPRIDSRTLARFVDEARIASQLTHPGIIPVHEVGTDDVGRVFFTMKLVKGVSLGKVFERVRRGEEGWDQVRALGVLSRVCEAMAYAHARGVVHRDLKPANIMVGPFGEAYVMDWGLARAGAVLAAGLDEGADTVVDSLRATARGIDPVSPLLTGAKAYLGTPYYMSPEQARGDIADVGPASDVYSVGAMLYELLAGRPPYHDPKQHRDAHSILDAVRRGPPTPIESLAERPPLELVAISERAMQRDIAKRYADMEELADDLKAFLDRRVVSAYESGTWAETKKWVVRNKALAASLVAVIVTLLVLFESSRLNGEALKAKNRELTRLHDTAERALYRAIIDDVPTALRAGNTEEAHRLLASAPERLRGWEWRYLSGEMHTYDITFNGSFRAFIPGTTVAVVVDVDGGLRTVDLETNVESMFLEASLTDDWVSDVRFTGSGDIMLVVGGHAEEVRPTRASTWSPSTKALLSSVELGDGYESCEIHGEGRWSAVYRDHITTYDISNGAVVGYVSTTGDEIVARSGATILYRNGTLRSATDTEGEVVGGVLPDDDVLSQGLRRTLSRRGTFLACWDPYGDEPVVLWERPFDRAGLSLNGVGGVVECRFSDDESVLFVFSGDGRVVRWDTQSRSRLGGPIATASGDTGVGHVIAPDGRAFVCGIDGTTFRWSCDGGGMCIGPSYAFDARSLLTTPRDPTTIMTSELRGGSDSDWYYRGAFSDDGRWFARNRRAWRVSRPSELLVESDALGDFVSDVCHTSDGARVILGYDEGVVEVWDSLTRRRLGELHFPLEQVERLVPAGDARHVFVQTVDDSYEGRCVYIVDVDAFQVLHVFDTADYITGVRASGSTAVVTSVRDWVHDAHVVGRGVAARLDFPDGAEFIEAHWLAGDALPAVLVGDGGAGPQGYAVSGRSLVRSVQGGRLRHLAPCIEDVGADSVLAVSRDLERVVYAGHGGIWLRDLIAMASVRLEGSAGAAFAVFSPDGKRLFSSHDSGVNVWDAKSGDLLLRLEGHSGDVYKMSLSPDGAELVSVCAGGEVRVWGAASSQDVYEMERGLDRITPAAAKIVDQLRSVTPNWSVVADAIRADRGLDSIYRRAALNIVTQRAYEERNKPPGETPAGADGF